MLALNPPEDVSRRLQTACPGSESVRNDPALGPPELGSGMPAQERRFRRGRG